MFKMYQYGLPWWSSGYESALQRRGHRFDPWSGQSPRATEQLSPRTAGPVLCNERRPHDETLTRAAPPATPRETPEHSNESPAQPDINLFLKKTSLVDRVKQMAFPNGWVSLQFIEDLNKRADSFLN